MPIRVNPNIYRFLVVAIIIAVAFYLLWHGAFANNTADKNTVTISLYYRNAQTLVWEQEPRHIKIEQEGDMLRSVLRELRNGPKASQLMKSIPEFIEPFDVSFTEMQSDRVDNKVVEITFTDSYYQMPPTEAADCISSLVWTLTELEFVNSLHIYIGDEELMLPGGEIGVGRLSRQNVELVISIEDIVVKETVKLYFAEHQGNGLVPEIREIEKGQNKSIEMCIIEAMVEGAKSAGFINVIPKETKVLLTKRDDIICYVDLSREFIDKLEAMDKQTEGSNNKLLAIASIVNALTENPHIKKVQIFIEGKKIVSENSSVDLSTPFERMENLILETTIN